VSALPFVDAAGVAALGVGAAADALEAALRAGLDPEAGVPRAAVGAGAGELLVMPAVAGDAVAVKLVTVGPQEPRIQGVCVVFDAATLAPVAVLDGIALTTLRTPAVSLVALRRLVAPGARRAVVLGRGPQGRAHADALRALLPGLEALDVLGSAGDAAAVVAGADVVVCATTAREPLFDGALVRDGACVVAVGSHEPDARELDDATIGSAERVVVESRGVAMREAGDIIQAVRAGAVHEESLVDLREVVRLAPMAGSSVFKSVGMGWQDLVVADLAFGRWAAARA